MFPSTDRTDIPSSQCGRRNQSGYTHRSSGPGVYYYGLLILPIDFQSKQNVETVPETPQISPAPSPDVTIPADEANVAPVPSELSDSATPEWNPVPGPSKEKGVAVPLSTADNADCSEGDYTSLASSSTLSSSAETTGWRYSQRPKRVTPR